MNDKEWKPNFPDWSKEKRCTPCRMPTAEIGNKRRMLSYKPVKCRDCIFAKISKCVDCGDEIRHCTYLTKQNAPPSTEIDKLRKCIYFVPRD